MRRHDCPSNRRDRWKRFADFASARKSYARRVTISAVGAALSVSALPDLLSPPANARALRA